jgi:hypothetical protein
MVLFALNISALVANKSLTKAAILGAPVLALFVSTVMILAFYHSSFGGITLILPTTTCSVLALIVASRVSSSQDIQDSLKE